MKLNLSRRSRTKAGVRVRVQYLGSSDGFTPTFARYCEKLEFPCIFECELVPRHETLLLEDSLLVLP